MFSNYMVSMLLELQIENFGIIEKLRFRPGKGLNVITGETGSGKSLIIQALGVVLGDRAGSGYIRNGAGKAVVEAIFDLSRREQKKKEIQEILKGLQIPYSDDHVSLKREITIDGKPKAYVNNIQVGISVLKDIGSRLVEIHGQHENQRLLDTAFHLDYLDSFANLEELREKVSSLYHRWLELKKKVRVVSLQEEEKKLRREYLNYAIKEIQEFQPREGEFEELQKERMKIINAGKLYEDLSYVYAKLHEDENSVITALQSIERIFEKNAGIDTEFADYVEMIKESLYNLESVVDFVREKYYSLNFSSERLEDIEERLEGYRKLFKKYGNATSQVLAKLQEFQKELHSIEMSDEEKEFLMSQIRVVEEELKEYSEELSRKRREAIPVLEKRIEEGLEQIGMKGAKLRISLTKEMVVDKEEEYKFSEKGYDHVEFLFCANEGEILLPLRKVASGGELSRIALILKSIILEKNGPICIVFDEVDTGVGGETGFNIGKKLKDIALSEQVIVITHLHQVASMADRHYKIYKETRNARTYSHMERVVGENRLKELARMLGGEDVTSYEYAKEILFKNKEVKKTLFV